MSNKYVLISATSGSSFTSGSFAGSGMPRIYENNALYIYRLEAQLLRSTDYATFTNIAPSNATVSTMVQLGTTMPVSLIFVGTQEYYQNAPTETSGGWTSSGSMPASSVIIDAVTDLDGTLTLAGNSHVGAEARISKDGVVAPFTFSRSDTGINTSAIISDLEIAE